MMKVLQGFSVEVKKGAPTNGTVVQIKGVLAHLYRTVNQPICGNVKTRTDAKGKVTTMAYDAQNRLVSTTDRWGGVTLSNYNCCHLVSNVDAENQMTAYAYNSLGEKIRETLPDHLICPITSAVRL